MLLALGKVYYADAKAGVATEHPLALLAQPGARVDWDAAASVALGERDLEKVPAVEDADFGEPSPEAANARSYPAWGKAFAEWAFRTQSLRLLRSPSTGALSAPGESERDFRIRLSGAGHESRDAVTERIRQGYAPRIARLEERIRAAEAAVDREKSQVQAQGIQTAVSVGTAILGAFLGRKSVSIGTLGRAATAARGAGRVAKEQGDVGRAQENLQALVAQRDELLRVMEEEIGKVRAAADPRSEELAEVVLAPKRKDVAVSLVALAWAPHRPDGRGGLAPAW
jgi:hypothetical protein